MILSDAFGSGTTSVNAAQPTQASWSLENFLNSTDALQAFFVGASSDAIDIALPTLSHDSATDTTIPRNDRALWGLTHFLTHNERIDNVRMGVDHFAAAQAHQRTLLAQMDIILARLQAAV